MTDKDGELTAAEGARSLMATLGAFKGSQPAIQETFTHIASVANTLQGRHRLYQPSIQRGMTIELEHSTQPVLRLMAHTAIHMLECS